MSAEIKQLLDTLQIKPKSYAVYLEAFTHRSYAFDNNLNYSYERLEFLGDAIISMLVCEYLFRKYPDKNEGEMTKAKIMIVQSNTEIQAAEDLGLDKCLLVGESIKHDTTMVSKKIYEDCFESFIGALFLDQGEQKVMDVLNKSIIKLYENQQLDASRDYKSLFQEAVQKYGKKSINYKLINHNINSFEVELWCNNIKYGHGTGNKIKEAEKNAAMDAYNKLIKKI